MPSRLLSAKGLKDLACPAEGHKVDFHDTGCKGLMLEVRASGGRTWYLRYRDGRGKPTTPIMAKPFATSPITSSTFTTAPVCIQHWAICRPMPTNLHRQPYNLSPCLKFLDHYTPDAPGASESGS